MAIADGPGCVIALMITLKVAVSIDEVASRVAQLLQRTEDRRAGRSPVRSSDQAFKAEVSKKRNSVFVESCLHLQQERRGILVARRFLVEHIPQRSKCDSSLTRDITHELLSFPRRERGFEGAVFFDDPSAKHFFQDLQLGVRNVFRIE